MLLANRSSNSENLLSAVGLPNFLQPRAEPKARGKRQRREYAATDSATQGRRPNTQTASRTDTRSNSTTGVLVKAPSMTKCFAELAQVQAGETAKANVCCASTGWLCGSRNEAAQTLAGDRAP